MSTAEQLAGLIMDADLPAHLEAENTELRAALEEIAAYAISDNLNYYNARHMIETAREALKKSRP